MLVFAALNLALLPLAYLGAIYKKLQRLCSWRTDKIKKKDLGSTQGVSQKLKLGDQKASVGDLILFVVLGVPILFLDQLRDLYSFTL